MDTNTLPTTTQAPADDQIRDQLLCFFDGDPDAPSAFTPDWLPAVQDSTDRWTHTKPAADHTAA